MFGGLHQIYMLLLSDPPDEVCQDWSRQCQDFGTATFPKCCNAMYPVPGVEFIWKSGDTCLFTRCTAVNCCRHPPYRLLSIHLMELDSWWWEGGGGEDEEKRVPSEEKKVETKKETKGGGWVTGALHTSVTARFNESLGFHLKYHTLILTKCDIFPRFSA